jgi:hypothetical protein
MSRGSFSIEVFRQRMKRIKRMGISKKPYPQMGADKMVEGRKISADA